jgi:hypothetical protein
MCFTAYSVLMRGLGPLARFEDPGSRRLAAVPSWTVIGLISLLLACLRLSCLFSIFTVTHVLYCNAWAVQNSWMTGDPERDNCPDLVNCSDPSEKSNERVRTDGRPAREISNVIAQESLPALRRRTASPDHVSCNGRFAYVDPEHQQFAVDARCAPRRILPAHSADQRAQLAVDPGPAATPPRLPAPIRSEPAPMPTKHSFRLYNDNGVHHDGNSRDSQTKIRPSMFRKRTPASRLAAQHQQLLAKNEDLRLARGASSKRNAGRAESDLATRTSRVAVTHSPALRHADDVLNRDNGSVAPLQRRKMKISTSLHRKTGYFVVGKSRVAVTRSIHRAEPWGCLTKS